MTHITQLNKLKDEYSSLDSGTPGPQDIHQSGRGHDVSYEEGAEGGHGLQRGRAGRPLKHRTPREKQSAHSKYKVYICVLSHLFILDRRERKRMGELVEAYKRLKKILPNSENIKSKRSILEQVRSLLYWYISYFVSRLSITSGAYGISST